MKKIRRILRGMSAPLPQPQRDPALTSLLESIEQDPTGALAGLDLQMSPELTRLLERGLIGSSLPPVLKDSKAAKAFQQAFDMIGGVPRLALWADQNPTKFYGLYSKLVPATAELTERKDININISWATSSRLSYQNPTQEVIENAPNDS